ncbi:response regulator [Mucilaginibacter sp. 22184]|uniref:response regulator n=1 Tax=Mucilaginibacter sp. 22184 TaxID=3453887 RepID=UPI003F8384C9
MFQNVLIAEDQESASISVRKTLEDLGILLPRYAYYCDDALMWVKKSLQEGSPYDLLITDLFFEEDDRKQKISGGAELILAAKQVQPDLKTLVFSAESKVAVIDGLFKVQGINGYVRKARYDAQELKVAMEEIYKGKLHFPAHFREMNRQKNAYAFSNLDITIISLLAQGVLQKDIPAYLAQNQIRPSGLSSVEKRLNQMKEVLEFSKNEQLVAFCKDMGMI